MPAESMPPGSTGSRIRMSIGYSGKNAGFSRDRVVPGQRDRHVVPGVPPVPDLEDAPDRRGPASLRVIQTMQLIRKYPTTAGRPDRQGSPWCAARGRAGARPSSRLVWPRRAARVGRLVKGPTASAIFDTFHATHTLLM